MTIDVAFLSAFALKSDLDQFYSGGIARFDADFPNCRSDDHLIRLPAMSGGDLSETVDQLVKAGLPRDRISLADWTGGPWEQSPGIRFQSIQTGSFPPERWTACADLTD